MPVSGTLLSQESIKRIFVGGTAALAPSRRDDLGASACVVGTTLAMLMTG
jgi:hypothetical protein